MTAFERATKVADQLSQELIIEKGQSYNRVRWLITEAITDALIAEYDKYKKAQPVTHIHIG